jgi:hypothetical protein
MRADNQRGDVSSLSSGVRRFGGPKIISYSSVLAGKIRASFTPAKKLWAGFTPVEESARLIDQQRRSRPIGVRCEGRGSTFAFASAG